MFRKGTSVVEGSIMDTMITSDTGSVALSLMEWKDGIDSGPRLERYKATAIGLGESIIQGSRRIAHSRWICE